MKLSIRKDSTDFVKLVVSPEKVFSSGFIKLGIRKPNREENRSFAPFSIQYKKT